MNDMIGATVQQELERRGECKAGLQNVLVTVRDHQGNYAVRYLEWGPTCLELTLFPEAFKDHDEEEKQHPLKPGQVFRLFSMAELDALKPDWPPGTLHNVPAADCTLVSVWPVVCCPRGRRKPRKGILE